MALMYPICNIRFFFSIYGRTYCPGRMQAVTVNKNIFLFCSNPFIIYHPSVMGPSNRTYIETIVFRVDDLSLFRVTKGRSNGSHYAPLETAIGLWEHYDEPEALQNISAIAVNHDVWIFGHPHPRSEDWSLSSRTVLRFNTKNCDWNTIETYGDIPRTYPFSDPMCKLEDKIYIFHNFGDEHSDRSMFSFDLGSRMWRRVLSNAWDEGWVASNAVPLEKKIYVLLKDREEARKGVCFVSRLSVYDIESGTWQLIELSGEGPRNYYCLHTFVYSGNIYAVENGCRSNGRKCLGIYETPPKVMKYSPRENEWTAVTIEGVYLHSSDTFSVVDDKVFFFDYDNSVCVLDFLPTLRKLSITAVKKYNLDELDLPSVLQDELKVYDDYLLILKELPKD